LPVSEAATNFRLIGSGIMMSRPSATYSIAAVFAGIFLEASRGPLRAAAFCHGPARKKKPCVDSVWIKLDVDVSGYVPIIRLSHC